MMRGTFVFAMIACPAIPLLIGASVRAADSTESDGAATATLIVESTELAGMRSIPIINSRDVTFTISSFDGCPADAKQAPPLKKLVSGKLVPKKNSLSESIPGNTDLAVFVTFTNTSGGNFVSCERGLRFRSEPGKTYHLQYIPPKQQMFHARACDMTIVEIRDGADLPVPSEHDALMENNGFWKGSDLNICAAPKPVIDRSGNGS